MYLSELVNVVAAIVLVVGQLAVRQTIRFIDVVGEGTATSSRRSQRIVQTRTADQKVIPNLRKKLHVSKHGRGTPGNKVKGES